MARQSCGRVATEARSATVTQSLVGSVSGQCACHCREDLLRPCAGGHAHCSRSVCPAMSLKHVIQNAQKTLHALPWGCDGLEWLMPLDLGGKPVTIWNGM